MHSRRIFTFVLIICLIATLLTGCAKSGSEEHEPITMLALFPDTAAFVDKVHEKYPEINIELTAYGGANMSAYIGAQLKSGDMPDIFITTNYLPEYEDLSDHLIDLSGYEFTNNFSEAHLQNISDKGALYLLPTFFSAIGITYNKTLLDKHGWSLPETLDELEELAAKAKAAGVNLALDQYALPGYGFQYLCNILDTGYLNTPEGRKWQNDFLSGKATLADSPQMSESFEILQKWKDIGMLNDDADFANDVSTKKKMAEGNTLFMLGGTNNFENEDTTDEFGIMPYLSEDGTKNTLILQIGRYVGINKKLQKPENKQKLEDALHVLEVLSTVEGMSTLNESYEPICMLPLKEYKIPEDSYYKQVESELDAGMTAPFLYNGWENIIVPIGNVAIDFIRGRASLDDVKRSFDENQYLLLNNADGEYTTITEKLNTDECARLVGICFAKAADADLALVSKNRFCTVDGKTVQNNRGVSGELFALPVTDQELTAILPTGWRDNIQTVTLTGAEIKELYEEGCRHPDSGVYYPYEMVTPEGMKLEDDKTYKAAICGVSEETAAKGRLQDTGILGLAAARDFLRQYASFSKSDLVWRQGK